MIAQIILNGKMGILVLFEKYNIILRDSVSMVFYW